MNKTAVLLILLSTFYAYGQQRAVTDSGDPVNLFKDGTWKYINEDNSIGDKINSVRSNLQRFTRNQESTLLIKSKKTNTGIWLNPEKWSYTAAESNLEAEYEFQLNGQNLYAMMIAESIEIPMDELRTIALENGRESAPDLEVVKEEHRVVNGQKVLHLQMNGTLQGIKFTYYGYYYSNKSGTVQLITYTAQGLIEGYKEDAEILLNGFVKLN